MPRGSVTQYTTALAICMAAAPIHAAQHRLPLWFEEHAAANGAKVYLARGVGYGLLLSDQQAEIALPDAKRMPRRLRMRLTGARSEAKAEGAEALPGRVNYLVGREPSQWRRGIATFGRVRYRAVYPGIDLDWYGNDGRLEYDFLVAPGADPSRIALRFDGVNKARVDLMGNLLLHIAGPGGSMELRQKPPLAYQEIDGRRKRVVARYQRRGDREIAFTLGDYDRTRPLVIDPVLEFSSYFGGAGNDLARAVALDSDGNIVIAGATTSAANFHATSGAFRTTYGGSGGFPNRAGGVVTGDAFVAKIRADGTAVLWCTYLGGANDDVALAVAVGPENIVAVGGSTLSSDFPVGGPLVAQARYGGAENVEDPLMLFGDAFVTRLSADGRQLVTSTYLGGDKDDRIHGIAFEPVTGYVFATGSAMSNDFPVIPNSLQVSPGGRTLSRNIVVGWGDAFVVGVTPFGELATSTFFGGNRDDAGMAIAFIPNQGGSDAFVTGFTESATFPITPAVFQPAFGGFDSPLGLQHTTGDAFVLRMRRDGRQLMYSTFLGGVADETGLGIAVDAQGNAYVTGQTLSTNFPVTQGVFQRTHAGSGGISTLGSGDAFIAKINPTGSALVYSTFLGGSADDGAKAIALDASGRAYVVGTTNSANFPVTSDALQPAFAGAAGMPGRVPGDGFVARLKADGTGLDYASYHGGSGDDLALGVAVDSRNAAYIVGATVSGNLRTTTGVVQPAFRGPGPEPRRFPIGDAFYAKIGGIGETTPAPGGRVTAVVHAATFQTKVSPGCVISIFFDGVEPAAATAQSVPLPTDLAGTQVLVNGAPIPLFGVFPPQRQINAQLPYLAPGPATVALRVGTVTTAQFNITVLATAPGIVVFGANRAVVVNQNGAVNTSDTPAPPRSVVTAYMTGQGTVSGFATAGAASPADPLALPTALSSARIGTVEARIAFIGLTPGGVGLLQANIEVPDLPPGDYPVTITIGAETSNAPVMTIGQ